MNDLEKATAEVFDKIMSLPVCENVDQRKGRKEVIDILRSVTGNDFGWICCDDKLLEKDECVIVCYPLMVQPSFWMPLPIPPEVQTGGIVKEVPEP